MRNYDVKCPHCGTMNKHLYLEETNGWMICQNCGKDYKAANFAKVTKIPVYTGEQLARMGAPKKHGKLKLLYLGKTEVMLHESNYTTARIPILSELRAKDCRLSKCGRLT